MASKPALELVIGASVSWTLGAAFRTVEDRIRQLERISSNATLLDNMIGQAIHLGDELVVAHDRGAAASNALQPYLQANLDLLRQQVQALVALREHYQSLVPSENPFPVAQAPMPPQGAAQATSGVMDRAAWQQILLGSPAMRMPSGGARRDLLDTRGDWPPDPGSSPGPGGPPSRGKRTPGMFGSLNMENVGVGAAESAIKIGLTYFSDQSDRDKALEYGETVGGLIGTTLLGYLAESRFKNKALVPYAEMLGGLAGENLGRLAVGFWYDDPATSQTASERSVPPKPVSLLRTEAAPVPAFDTITHLTRMPATAPPSLLIADKGQGTGQSMSGWMDKRWFGANPAPVQAVEQAWKGRFTLEGASVLAPFGGGATAGAAGDQRGDECKDGLKAGSVKSGACICEEPRAAVSSGERQVRAGPVPGNVTRWPSPVASPPTVLPSLPPAAPPTGVQPHPISQQVVFPAALPLSGQGSATSTSRPAVFNGDLQVPAVPVLGNVTRTLNPATSQPTALASLPPAIPLASVQPAPITQQITFAPNMPITVQGSVTDPAQLALDIEPIVRRQFDEMTRMAANRQLADPTHV